MKKTLLILMIITAGFLSSIKFHYEHYLFVDIGKGYGVIFCEEACWHETGHAIDYELGRPSHSRAFQDTVDSLAAKAWAEIRGVDGVVDMEDVLTPAQFVIMAFPGVSEPLIKVDDPFMKWLGSKNGGWGGYSEIYAEILQVSEGDPENMPPELWEFYDFDLAEAIYQAVR